MKGKSVQMDGDKRKRKILLVVRWPVGGIRTFLKYVFSRFTPEDYEFVFVGKDGGSIAALRHDLDAIVCEWNLFPADGAEAKSCARLVWQALKAHDIDLVHAHGFTSAFSSIVPAKLKKVPVICTSHDVLLTNQFEGWKGLLKKAGLFTVLSQCDLVQSVSVDAQANLSEILPWLRSSKMIVVLNGVDTQAFDTATARNLKEIIGIPNDTVLIGFFGRFMGQKGFGVLVDAIEQLRHGSAAGNVHVACFGSGAFIREEQAALKRRNLLDAFTFFPFTADISGAMKGCDLIAMPSLWEACPLQPMEALAAGVPFVGSDCMGLSEVLDGTPAVVVKKGDAESLAQGIIECISKSRQPFTDYVREAVERFDVERTAREIQIMYDQVLR